MPRVNPVVPWVLVVAVAVTVVPAQAQSNLDAGKSPAQIFANTCNACHRSPRELKQTNAYFLREHYNTGGRQRSACRPAAAASGFGRWAGGCAVPEFALGHPGGAPWGHRRPSGPGNGGAGPIKPRKRIQAAPSVGQRGSGQAAGRRHPGRRRRGRSHASRHGDAAGRPVGFRGIARNSAVPGSPCACSGLRPMRCRDSVSERRSRA